MSHPTPLYILAGGRSSRFGSDKARALLDGRPLALHVLDMLRAWSPTSRATLIVRDPADWADHPIRALTDRRPDLGPLAGMEAALLDLSPDEPWCLIAPCDTLGVRPEWLDLLASARQPGDLASAFRDADAGRWHPLPLLLHRDAHPTIDRALTTRQLTAWRTLDALHARSTPSPPGWADLRRIDTRETLDMFER